MRSVALQEPAHWTNHTARHTGRSPAHGELSVVEVATRSPGMGVDEARCRKMGMDGWQDDGCSFKEPVFSAESEEL